MNGTLGFNTGNIRDVADYLVNQANMNLDSINQITSKVEAFGANGTWTGTTYNAFLATYQENQARLENMKNELDTIANGLSNVASIGDETVANITNFNSGL